MIIESIINGFMDLLDLLFRNIVLAPIAAVNDLLNYFGFIIGQGIGLFRFIFPPASRGVMAVILACHIGLLVYYIVLWVIKKIPMLGIH